MSPHICFEDLGCQGAACILAGADRTETVTGWSRRLPGGGADALQHTFSVLQLVNELWSIGGKQRNLLRQHHRNITIASRAGEEEKRRRGDFKETEGITVYTIKEDLRTLRS